MQKHYDIIAIGAGSGGLSAIQKANEYGKKCAIIEMHKVGGTCVNAGCVPKKIMWYAANTMSILKDAKKLGIQPKHCDFSWQNLKNLRDEYIQNINNWYEQNLKKSGIDYIQGFAKLIDKRNISVNGKKISANHIVIATGGKPFVPNIKGSEFGITSDDFFELEKMPKKIAIIGGGFIAVELAGMMRSLGSDVSIIIKSKNLLNSFDSMIVEQITKQYINQGIKIISAKTIQKIDEKGNIYFTKGTLSGFDKIIFATGRTPMTKNIGLEEVGVKVNSKGYIKTNSKQNTNIKGIYAIGDITGKTSLTPLAIAQGKNLAKRIFLKKDNSKINYNKVPIVIFSHPTIATIGLNEEQAKNKFKQIKLYQSNFMPMSDVLSEHQTETAIKLICVNKNNKVVGCHMVGKNCDEILQGFAVAIQMGLTKEQLDNSIAIHPTSAEELLSMS